MLHWNSWNSSAEYESTLLTLCPVTTCIFTSDRSLLNDSSAVLFSFDDNTTVPIFPLPTHRRSRQRFVFVAASQHTPNLNGDFFRSADEDTHWFVDYFNWTMTHRPDSDIVLRDALGTFVPLKTRRHHHYSTFRRHKKGPNEEEDSAPSGWMTRPSKRLRALARIGDKKKLIAWFPTQCITSVRREDYVRQLSRYIPIDIYGECGNNNLTCPAGGDCFDMLRSEYKFYLAFEESWCPNHAVTTEFYKALASDAVPVVLGGVDYDTLGPPHSFVNALDFPSAKSLAEYLLFLVETPEMYARYFDWKSSFQISLKPMSGWCDLCRLLHDSTLPAKVYGDIRKWWVDDDAHCHSKLIAPFLNSI